MNIKVINTKKSASHSSPESNYYTCFVDETRYTSVQSFLNTTLAQNQCTKKSGFKRIAFLYLLSNRDEFLPKETKI